MARRELIDRWRTGNLRTEILRRLADGSSLLDLELSTVEGRLDLRGFPAGGLDSQAPTIAGVDLQYATLARAHLEDVNFRDCRFDGADLTRAVFTDGSIAESTMVRATLQEAILARTTWQSVDLTGAKMKKFSAERTHFAGCTFPALPKAEFAGCTIEDSVFTGALIETRFLGRAHDSAVLRRVTFQSDEAKYPEFDGVDFDEVTFPPGDNLIVVPRNFKDVAERAGRLSSGRDDQAGKDLRRFLSHESLRPGLRATAGWATARHVLVDGYPSGAELADLAVTMLRRAAEDIDAVR
ncbi:pentapeptide repeat-containing protein [Actinoplanes sp. TRM 88003]|uniref:Pentapeptide repeat-containing protein n=1 Tax=Paractinoplanes aksuensis TaxID=2939490 RepID=A0ABT1DLX7_9ACTN|nr:pentapeptide repeat-containing protein [Actinoplanes aksuensis]MCO8271814.1 pentapeptide repeat-containing protein [Actinoplanes aksuensis]